VRKLYSCSTRFPPKLIPDSIRNHSPAVNRCQYPRESNVSGVGSGCGKGKRSCGGDDLDTRLNEHSRQRYLEEPMDGEISFISFCMQR
jgi:hypothetical protein